MTLLNKAALAVFAMMIGVPAVHADPEITLTLTERDEPRVKSGKLCMIGMELGGTHAKVDMIYAVNSPNGPNDLCHMSRDGGSRTGPYCGSDYDMNVACADLKSVSVAYLACADENGAPVACGTPKLMGDGAAAEKLELASNVANRASTEIYMSALNDKQLFDKPFGCEMDVEVRFDPPSEKDKVEFTYALFAKGEESAVCEVDATYFTRGGGCNMRKPRFTCADIERVEVREVTCLDADDASRSCGDVDVRTFGIPEVTVN